MSSRQLAVFLNCEFKLFLGFDGAGKIEPQRGGNFFAARLCEVLIILEGSIGVAGLEMQPAELEHGFLIGGGIALSRIRLLQEEVGVDGVGMRLYVLPELGQ